MSGSSKVVSKYPEMKVVMDALVEMQGADAEKFSNWTGKLSPIIDLCDDILDDIIQKRNETQAALDQAFETFENKSQALRNAVSDADTKWNGYKDCMVNLTSLRADFETARTSYNQVKSDHENAETERDGAKDISEQTASETFSCNLLHDSSLCSQDRSDFQSKVNNDTNQTLQRITTDLSTYATLVENEAELRQHMENNDTKRTDTLVTWYDETGTCQVAFDERRTKVCHVGQAYDSKCVAHGTYQSIKTRTNETGHDESDVDRASEWSVVKKIKCILERWSTGTQVSDNTAGCLGLDYSIEVGNIDFHDTEVDNRLNEEFGEQNHKFDCEDNGNIKFGNGKLYSPRPRDSDFSADRKDPELEGDVVVTYSEMNKRYVLDSGHLQDSSTQAGEVNTFSNDLYEDDC